MTKLYITTITFFLLVNLSFGQDSNSITNISDNLGYTTSSRAIYKGSLLTGIGFGYSEVKAQSIGYDFSNKTITAPGISIGYGLFNNIDFHVNVGMQYQEYNLTQIYSGDTTKNHGSSYKVNSFGFGTKINLFKQKGWVPQLAYSLEVNTLFDSQNSLSYMNNTLAFAYYLGEKFRLGGNLGLRTRLYVSGDSEGSSHLFYSLNLRYEFIDGFGAFLDFKPANISDYIMNSQVGLFYRLNNNMQLNLNAGKLLFTEPNFPTKITFISGGFSWLLLR